MLPLEAKARLRGWSEPVMMKVAGLPELAAGRYPVERMVLDLRALEQRSVSSALLSLPWGGFLVQEGGALPDGRPGIELSGDQAIVNAGDVVETRPAVSRVSVRYRRGDNGNVLFATERCNSFCLMCSQPPRQIEDEWRVEQICSLIELIDKNEPSIAISGGEPTLLGPGLPRIIRKCADDLPDTHVHVLSNGRRFADPGYAQCFEGIHQRLSWGIPLYGDHYRLHDYVVQSAGAFAQTMRGLYSLHSAGQRIEIRVVLVKPAVERLRDTVRYIHRDLPFVEHVALMGVEPIGFAKAHHAALWIDPADMSSVLEDAVGLLDRHGITVSLYNLPLCVLPKTLWPHTQRSISNWKQDYLPMCNSCAVKDRCGGFFSWVTPDWTSRAIAPIQQEDATCRMH